jgi:tRNA threonylcarbamoyladenosine biosynthesis protein TsaB
VPTILALDTTNDPGSIALSTGDGVIEEVILQPGDGFAQVLFDEIKALLERNSLTLADLDGFAAASGPGTFTGVRVGLTAVKGLAEALSRKVVAVSNLKAMAYFGTHELRAPTIDARRGEIYGAAYNAALEPIRPEVVMKSEEWLASLPAEAEILSTPRPLAGAIGRIAAREFAAGRAVDPMAIDANYVRRSDAEHKWTDAI